MTISTTAAWRAAIVTAACTAVIARAALPGAPLEIGSRLELFVDRYLIDRLEGTSLKLGLPVKREVSFRFDQPWERPFAGAASVVKGPSGIYRFYYRGAAADAEGNYSADYEVTCVAESRDGIVWTKPNLGLYEYHGSRNNNIILRPTPPFRSSHNFAVFLDARPGIDASERYKAVGGAGGKNGAGLFRWVSADGVRWRLFSEAPLFKGYALDTLNIAFWSPSENCYVAYIRTWSQGGTPDQPDFSGKRTMSRSVSRDFVNWSEPKVMSFGNAPEDELYTIGSHPYFRAPHIQIALPFRIVVGRNVLTEAEAESLDVQAVRGRVDPRLGQGLGARGTGHGLGAVSDAVLMSSRGGFEFDRTFMESFIRPGLERAAWTARSNCPAFNIVPTSDTELSLYLQVGYTSNQYHVRRYSLRIDGFASVNAPFAGGEMTTKPVVFEGEALVVNYSTSSIGHVKVELQDARGQPLPGFALADCDEIVGDEIKRVVSWRKSSDLSSLRGKPVRLRFAMKDADLYLLQCRTQSSASAP
jgi:hypothetical protein